MDQDMGDAQPQPSETPSPGANREAALTIGDLGERTGVSPAVLRMWETRHGFPEPRRIASGHRRYSEADVHLVRHVLRRKEAGTRLEVAIADALSSGAPVPTSIFAELRRKHRALAPQRLRKSTLIALSWAIEDECCAVADTPILFGAFQRQQFFASSSARWHELARVARAAIVFADAWDGVADHSGPVRAALTEDAPLRREWAVVCDAADSPACLSAWELPGQQDVPDWERRFEAVWTVDPTAVRDAARAAAGVAAAAGAPSAQQLVDELATAPISTATTPPGTTALFNRVVSYVDRLA
ncbi:MerR family transcriptional regulator [Nocardioides humilatus]|uniref:MerR family transcriptional regulator n=1 Tax=Nocardioides humilatus TaxID=2607660 RepID=A0A5B1LMV1_9ACTN|nr:DICT sensory domain-containing protein [Nocardioides humilatus]KAA1420967.1 MerR family transcriptional regulator [Nocardioides humilatus]